MTGVPVVAVRVMRARKESVCTICSGLVSVGQQIARCPGGLWVHAGCFIGHRHNVEVVDVQPETITEEENR